LIRLPGRGRVVVVSFAPFLACVALGVAAGVVGGGAASAILALLAAVAFLAQPVLLWQRILSAGPRLERATQAWLAGDPTLAESTCPAVLGSVFRGDYRARALHLWGLALEQRGQFADAAQLFALADAAVPTMAAPMRKKQARSLILAHRGFCLAASGQVEEATRELTRANDELKNAGHAGVLDALTDDAAWGLGAASMNETLVKIEGQRPLRAVLSLAWALHHHARAMPRELAHLLQAERGVFERGLLPRELALIERLGNEAQRALAQGIHRSPGLLPSAIDPWVEACLAGAAAIPQLPQSPSAT
jgi:tetratricopeptide (TPR) repeat protein